MEDKLLDVIRDFTKFAPAFFIVRAKSGKAKPFLLNTAQKFVHNRLEIQLKATGKVRAIILKGRQQGMSTLIQARYFHKVITTRGLRAFILTHEAEATKNLFEMTKRYYDQLPDGLAPKADKSSAKELRFSSFDSGYSVGTAGNKGTGRSQTIQLFHGSEVALWDHADEHSTGVLQAVPSEPGTEIILESTAKGIGNYYHKMWVAATSGESDYQAIFVPWYWQDEYKSFVKGFKMDDSELELYEMYKSDGLIPEHLCWRRIKLSDYGDQETGIDLFKQEYPMNAEEAFRNPIDNVFINAKYVMKARKAEIESDTALIIGVDPAIGDNDRTAIIRRRGRLAYKLETFRNHNTMEVAGRLVQIIKEERPHRIYIDCIGIGAGIVDRMREMGYEFVEGVNVARSPNDKKKFKNLRAELWWEMRDWLMQEMPVQIPDSDELHGDLCSLGYKYTSNGLLLIEGKDQLKARGMPSCDTADALMISFYAGSYESTLNVVPVAMPFHHQGKFI